MRVGRIVGNSICGLLFASAAYLCFADAIKAIGDNAWHKATSDINESSSLQSSERSQQSQQTISESSNGSPESSEDNWYKCYPECPGHSSSVQSCQTRIAGVDEILQDEVL